jgi:hypothetical protein
VCVRFFIVQEIQEIRLVSVAEAGFRLVFVLGKETHLVSVNESGSKNCRLAIRKSSAYLHKKMESKAKENSLENAAMSAATRLLAAQKEKPKSECLDQLRLSR